MARKRGRPKAVRQTAWRPTPVDRSILMGLVGKLGIGQADVLRLALRVLAERENLSFPGAQVPLSERASSDQQGA